MTSEVKRYTVVLIRSCAHSMGDGTGRGRRGRESEWEREERPLNGEYAYTCKSRVSLGHLMISALSTGNCGRCKPNDSPTRCHGECR